MGRKPGIPLAGPSNLSPGTSSAQTFMQLSRSPSQPSTPGHMQQSPSLANRQPRDPQINVDIQNIGAQAKHDLGLDEKDSSALTQDDKHRIVNQVRRIGLAQMSRKPGIPPARPSNISPEHALKK
ncbi:hypothetical protein BKA82DRAFT_918697 [Pisolithus tinctorius]|uniref:Uncharacterized protein n=1 Tax=Pisolithus tinctorius Marx 270 TaxID=870435 RepID=A0A0C3N7J3_PISTI|nr:hypothetical protein BKA82DRAFT_918697 [Pisolithus tinctorius]KIN97019.1 hypothetical protein M404DRAFT_918697 [Pisolithus tinctorius Marx 270]